MWFSGGGLWAGRASCEPWFPLSHLQGLVTAHAREQRQDGAGEGPGMGEGRQTEPPGAPCRREAGAGGTDGQKSRQSPPEALPDRTFRKAGPTPSPSILGADGWSPCLGPDGRPAPLLLRAPSPALPRGRRRTVCPWSPRLAGELPRSGPGPHWGFPDVSLAANCDSESFL